MSDDNVYNTMNEPATNEPAPMKADPASPSGVVQPTPVVAPHPLDGWFEKWFPENSAESNLAKPITYLSAEWHYIQQAYADLRAEFDKKLNHNS